MEKTKRNSSRLRALYAGVAVAASLTAAFNSRSARGDTLVWDPTDGGLNDLTTPTTWNQIQSNTNWFDTGGALGSFQIFWFNPGVTSSVGGGPDIAQFNDLGNPTYTITIDDSADPYDPTVNTIAAGGLLFADNSVNHGIYTIAAAGSTTLTLGSAITGVGTIDVQASSANISANIVAGYGLTVNPTGTGTLLLSGTNTITGALTLDGGTLNLSGPNTISGGLTVVGGTLTLSNTNTITGGVTLDAGALQITTAGALGSDPLTITTGTFSFNLPGGQSIGNVIHNNGAINATVTGTGANSNTLGGAIDGTGSLAVSGGGNLILSHSNTFSGNTSVASGTTLTLTNGQALADSTVTTGGTGLIFDSSVSSHAFTLGGLTGSTNLVLQDNAVTPNGIALTIGSAANSGSNTYSGVLSDGGVGHAGSLIKAGPSTLTLTQAATYIGGTTVNGGVLNLANATNAVSGTGEIIVNGGRLNANNPNSFGSVANAGNSILINENGTLSSQNGQLYLGRSINTDPAYTGGGTISSSGGSYILAGGNYNFKQAADGTAATFSGSAALFGNVALNVTHTSGSGPVDLNFSGNLSDYTGNTGTLYKNGNGVLALTGVNTYTGGTNVNAGTLTTGASLPLHGAVNFNNATLSNAGISGISALYFYEGNNPGFMPNGIQFGSHGNDLNIDTYGSLLNMVGGTSTFYGGTSNSPRATYTSPTVAVSGGNPGTQAYFNSAGTSDNMEVYYGGVLKVATSGTYNFNTGSDDGSTMYINGQQVVYNNYSQGTTYRGGSMNLVAGVPYSVEIGYYNGGGGWGLDSQISGPSVSGTQTIGNGTGPSSYTISPNLVLQSLTGTGNVVLGDGNLLTGFTNSSFSPTTFSGTISGTGGLTLVGQGTQILTNANTFSGTTTVAPAATLQLNNSHALGGSIVNPTNVTYNSAVGGSLTFGGLTGSGNLVLADNNSTALALTIGNTNGAAGNATYSGSITGGTSAGLTKTGNNTQAFTAVQNYNGPTHIQGGTVQLVGPLVAPGSGLQAWYSAGTGVTTNPTTGQVTSWNDLSGNGNNLVNLGGNPATVVANSINGKPAISFNQSFMYENGHSMTDGEEFIVFKSNTGQNSFGQNWGGPTGFANNGDHWMFQDQNNANNTAQWNGPTPNAVYQNGTAVPVNAPNGSPYGLSNPNSYMVLQVDPQHPDGGNAQFEVGGNNGGNWYNTNLNIAEVLVYNAPLSGAELNQVGTYLTDKYGISTSYTNLPGSNLLPTTDLSISSGGTLDIGGAAQTVASLSGGGNITNSTAYSTATLILNTSSPTTFGGNIADGVGVGGGTVALTMSGSSIQTLSGSNTYSGGTTVTSGTLLMGSSTALSPNGPVTVAGTGTLDLGGYSTTITLATAPAVSLQGGTLQNGTITNNGSAYDAQSGTVTATANLAGTAGLNKTTVGTVTLGGSNDYQGPTVVSAGTLQLNDLNAVHNSTVTPSGGTVAFGLSSGTYNFGGLAGTGNIALPGSVSLSVGSNGGSTSFTGALSGGNGLTKAGAGTLTLSTSQSYGGPTSISGGTLQLVGPVAAPTGGLQAWYSAGSGVVTSGSQVIQWNDLSGNGHNLANPNANAPQGTNPATVVPNDINHQPAINFNNSYLYANNTMTDGEEFIVFKSAYNSTAFGNDWGGPTGRTDGGHWMFQGNSSQTWDGNAPLAMYQNGTSVGLNGNGRYQVTNPNQYMVLQVDPNNPNGTTFEVGGNNVGSNWYQSNLDIAEILVYNTALSGSELNQVGTYLTDKYGISTSYTNIPVNNILPTTTDLTVTGTLDINSGQVQTVGSLSGGGNITNSVSGSTAQLTLTTSSPQTFSGNIADGAGKVGLTLSGSAVQTLSGSNTYSGGTTVTGGTLQISSATGLSTNGAITVAGGTLDLGGNSFTTVNPVAFPIGTGSGGTTQNGMITNNGSAYDAQAGLISAVLAGSAGMNKTTAGTVTLSNANTFTGVTNVTGGSLVLTNSLALQNSSVSPGGGIVFDSSVVPHAFTFAGLTGGGALALQDNAGSPNSVTLTIGNGNSGTVAYTGNISGGGGLTKVGSGTQFLSGTNTYTGTTYIKQGTIQLGAPGLTEGLVGTYFDTTTPLSAWAAKQTVPLARFGNPAGPDNTPANVGGQPNWSVVNAVGGSDNLATLTTDNTTWGYAGYIDVLNPNPAGTVYNFGGNFDDGVYLKVDGVATVIGTTWGTPNVASLTLTPGLHQIDLRFGEGGGGVGPVNGNFDNLGAAYNTAGNVSTTGGTWNEFGVNDSNTLFLSASANAQALPSTSQVVVSNGANLISGGGTVTIGSLSDDTTQVANGTASVQIGATVLTTGGDNSSTTFSGNITGTGGSLVKTGSGTFILAGANTYDGGTTINGGVLEAAANNLPATGIIHVNSGPSTSSTGPGFYLNQTLPGGSSSLVYSNQIVGNGAVYLNTAGTITLNGSNTYSGGTFIKGGTVISAMGSLGTGNVNVGATGTLSVSQGNIGLAGFFTAASGGLPGSGVLGTGNPIPLAQFQGLIASNIAGGQISLAPSISFTGNGGVPAAGYTLTQPTQFPAIETTGPNGGNNFVNFFSGMINISGTGDYTFHTASDDGSVLYIDGNQVVNNNYNQGVTDRSGTVLNLSAGEHSIAIGYFEGGGGYAMEAGYSGPDTGNTLEEINSSNAAITPDLIIGSLSGAGNVSLATGNLITGFDNSSPAAFSGPITGIGGITKLGTGTQIISGSNSYTGSTIILAGGLAGTTTSLYGNIANSGALIFDQTLPGTGTAGTGFAGTFNGTITGSGSVVKNSAGMVNINTPQSYSGGTFVNGGTLQISGVGTIGSGTLSVNSGAVVNLANTPVNALSAQYYNGRFNGNTGNITLSQEISGVASLGSPTISGTTTAINYGFATPFPSPYDTNGNNFTGIYSGMLNITTGGSYTFDLNSDDGSAVFVDGTSLVANNWNDQGTGNVRSGTVNLSPGAHYLSVAYYQGGGGYALEARYNGADTGNVATDLGVNTSEAFSVGSLSDGSGGGGTINLTTQSLIIGGDGTNTSYTGTINAASSLALVKVGAGVQSLGGANTGFFGNTIVAGGNLLLTNTNALVNSSVTGPFATSTASTTGVVFGPGITNFTFGALSGGNALPLQDTAAQPVNLSVGNNNVSTTYSGVASGPGSLTKIGTGTLTLTGANSFAGNLTVTSGIANPTTPQAYLGSTVVTGGTLKLGTTAVSPVLSGNLFNNVPEARGYSLDYQLSMPTSNANYAGIAPNYSVNNSALIANNSFSRIGYYMELQGSGGPSPSGFMYVSFNSANFSTNANQLGVPTVASGEFYHYGQVGTGQVQNMNIVTNVPGIAGTSSIGGGLFAGTGINTGLAQFWPGNYDPNNGYGVSGLAGSGPGSAGNFGPGDGNGGTGAPGYGSMKLAESGSQMLLAFNNWNSNNAVTDIGLGNNPGSNNTDYTFQGNNGYTLTDLEVVVGGVNGSNILPITTSVVLDTNGLVDLNGYSQQVVSLADYAGGSHGLITNTTAQPVTLTVAPTSLTSTTFSGVIADGSAQTSVTMNGTGAGSSATQILAAVNTYTGVTTITGGILSTGPTGNLNSGLPGSSIGASSNLASNLLISGGTLQYAGAANGTTDRLFTVGTATATIDAASPVTFTNTGPLAFSIPNTNASLTLTNSVANVSTFWPSITDNTGGTTSVSKTGIGAWVLAGTNSYTGGTTITGGTLLVGSPTALGNGTTGSPVTVHGTGSVLDLNHINTAIFGLSDGTVDSNGLVTSNAGSATLTINGSGQTYSGKIADGTTGQVSVVINSGTQTFGNFNGAGPFSSYTGGTEVKGGSATLIGIGIEQVIDGASAYAFGGNATSGGDVLVDNGGNVISNVVGGTAFAPHANVTVNGTATFTNGILDADLATINNTETIGQLNGVGDVVLLGNGYSTGFGTIAIPTNLIIQDGGTFAGNISEGTGTSTYDPESGYIYTGVGSTLGSVTFKGASLTANVLTLSGQSTYTGGTTVTGGTLLVSGSPTLNSQANGYVSSATGLGAVTVQGAIPNTAVNPTAGNSRLGGNGSIIGPVTVASGGIISPGMNPNLSSVTGSTDLGILTLTGNTNALASETWSGGGTYVWKTNVVAGSNPPTLTNPWATTAAGVAGEATLNQDLLVVNGELTIDNTGGLFVLNINHGADSGGYPFPSVSQFIVANALGVQTLTGSPSSPTTTDNTVSTNITADFIVIDNGVQIGGDTVTVVPDAGGYDVVVNITPEPGSLGLLGLASLGLLRRRRARNAKPGVGCIA